MSTSSDSDSTDSDSESQPKAAAEGRKKTSSSRGAAKFTSGGRSYKRRNPHCTDTIASLPSQDVVQDFFRDKRKCCGKATSNHSCLESYFLIDNEQCQAHGDRIKSVDTTSLYNCVTAFRTITRDKSDQDLENHLISEVRNAISGSQQRKEATGISDQFVYSWCLELKGGHKPQGPFIVCREVFAFVWGTTVSRIKRIVGGLKQSDYGYIFSSDVKSFTDESRYFEEFSYDEVESIMKKNLTMQQGGELALGTFEIGNIIS
jgi:hypothetical protein